MPTTSLPVRRRRSNPSDIPRPIPNPESRRRGLLGRARQSRYWWRVGWWTVALVGSLVAGALAASSVDQANQVTAALGHAELVWMTTHDLAVGSTIAASDIEQRVVPVGLLPTSGASTDAVGRIVRERVLQGEVVAEARLAPAGAAGPSALATADQRVVAIPRQRDPVAVKVGDRVDLIAVTTVEGRPTTVARNAAVVAVDSGPLGSGGSGTDAVSVAINNHEVEATAAALVKGSVVIALHPPT